MIQNSLSPAPRGRTQGVWQIVRYNAPMYLVGSVVCLLGLAGATMMPLPGWLRALACFGIGLALFWLVASLLVSFYVYDVSPLYRWQWLRDLIPAPQRWANIHSGLDESSPALRELFGREAALLDIYDADEMTEPSIARARRLTPPAIEPQAVDYRHLPFEADAFDAVFLLFTAHELRAPESRRQFFAELKRVLRPGGRIVIVEHMRDVANFIAFGPGFFHFLPLGEWRALARGVGLDIESELSMTSFVRVFVLQHSAL